MINGRKRQCRVDEDGFLLRVLVRAADSSDTEADERLPSEHYRRFLRMTEIRRDQWRKAGREQRRAERPSIKRTVIENPPEQKKMCGHSKGLGGALIPERAEVPSVARTIDCLGGALRLPKCRTQKTGEL